MRIEDNFTEEELMNEQWKDIDGYDGLYQVSDLGRVKSLWFGKEKILKAPSNKVGYRYVNICFNGKHTSKKVHSFVAAAFIGERPEGYEVDHIDNNPLNNRASNLQYVTRTENNRKRWEHTKHHSEETKKKISESNKGKHATTETIEKMIESQKKVSKPIICLDNGVIYRSINNAARELNLDRGSIHKCLIGKYKSTGGYHFAYCNQNENNASLLEKAS